MHWDFCLFPIIILHTLEFVPLFQWCKTRHLQLWRGEEFLQCDGCYQRECWTRWDRTSGSNPPYNWHWPILSLCCAQTGMCSTGITGTAGSMVPLIRAVGPRSCWNWPECWAWRSSRVRTFFKLGYKLIVLFKVLDNVTSSLWQVSGGLAGQSFSGAGELRSLVLLVLQNTQRWFKTVYSILRFQF